MSTPTRLTSLRAAADRRTAAPAKECEQRTAIRNLPRAGAEMHLSVCGCEHAPPPEGLRSLGHLPPQEGRMDMRVRMRSVSHHLTVCAAAAPFEDVVTLFDGFLLSAPLTRSSVSISGGIADWPHRRRCRTTSIPRSVCGPG